MNVFYEEDGTFKAAAILADNVTSLQVEALHGKRSKIKAASVLLRFETPPLSEFMDLAQTAAQDLDAGFLWECCLGDTEFSGEALAREYFGHPPGPVESAALLIRLHGSPIHFYKKGKGNYKAAPPEALKAALAGQEKKRRQLEQQARYVTQLGSGILPEEFKADLPGLLYRPDKNSVAWKAIDTVCSETKQTAVRLLEQCGAIPSTHDYHFNRFLLEYFPDGTALDETGISDLLAGQTEACNLPVADVSAFSIDDASTTEIDDAFSVSFLPLGSFRVGIHIAVPALGVTPGSLPDRMAAERLSTVYLPGNKITMLPETVIRHYTLEAGRLCPVVSMYVDVADDCTVMSVHSCIEQVRVADNLRNEELEVYFNERTLAEGQPDYPYSRELRAIWGFACKQEVLRGKVNDTNNERAEYSFAVRDDHVTISERRRGSPLDKVVSELMIYVNAEWGRQLAEGGVAGIYRNQGGGKVKMSTSPAPHQGLGVSQYAWMSSPMRRYVDLLNQRQLIALLRKETPFYTRDSGDLLVALRNFEVTYEAYGEFQRGMERYWCLRWLLQEKIATIGGQVFRENLVKLDNLPLMVRVPSLPDLAPGKQVSLEISRVDLLELALDLRFLGKSD